MAKDDTAAESAAPKKSKKMLIIIVAAVLILAIAGGAAAFLMMGSKGKKGHGEKEEQQAEHAPAKTVLVPFEEKFTVNIQSEDGSAHYLQVPRVELEAANEETAKNIEAMKSKLSDRISSLLRQKTMQEMMAPGSDLKLKEDLKRVINEALGVRSTEASKKGVTEVMLPASFIVQ